SRYERIPFDRNRTDRRRHRVSAARRRTHAGPELADLLGVRSSLLRVTRFARRDRASSAVRQRRWPTYVTGLPATRPVRPTRSASTWPLKVRGALFASTSVS